MPSSQSAYDLIKGSMRLIGAIATGETPSADEANDGLNTLNDLLETWSTENLIVWGSDNETFATVAGQALYTIGPAGNFNTVRPIRVTGAYCTFGGVDFPIQLIGPDEYNGIALKTQQQPIVEQLLYINDNPLGLIKLWPVPSQVIPIVLNNDRVLTQVASLATVMTFPPGHLIAMKHALAILLAPDYGVEPSSAVVAVATSTKANIKRANKIKRQATFDPALSSDEPAIWQRGY
jgi:hypothetical protein